MLQVLIQFSTGEQSKHQVSTLQEARRLVALSGRSNKSSRSAASDCKERIVRDYKILGSDNKQLVLKECA